MKIRTRRVSIMMALVMILTTILTNVCVIRMNENYVNAATLTLDEKPINPGDTAKSPVKIGNYFNGETFTSKNTLANGTVTSRFYRLKLGDGTGYADAYCGNITMGASSDKKYTASKVKIGTAMSIKNGNSTKSFTIDTKTYNIIRAVCISNGEYAGIGNVNDIRYTAGQIAIWRALYLCSEGKSTYDYSTFYSTGSSGDMSNIIGLIVNDIGETADTEKKMASMISDYLSKAKNGTYSDGDLLIWDDGITTDQKLFTASNVPTYEEHGQIAMTKVVKLGNGSTERRAGAVYGVYTNKACTSKVGEIGPTPDNGYALSNVLTTRTEKDGYYEFYLKEITAPIGSKLSTTVYGPITITKDGGIDRTYTMDSDNPIVDESNPANVYVYKISTDNETSAKNAAKDVAEDPDNISEAMADAWKQYGMTGAEYAIYHWSENKGKFVKKGTLTENTSAKRYHAELEYTTDNKGLFFIKETTAPDGFELDESNTSGFFIQIHKSRTDTGTKRWTKAQGGDGLTYKIYYRQSGGRVVHAFYNEPEVEISGKVILEKKGEEALDGNIPDATFMVQQYKDGEFVDYKKMKYSTSKMYYYLNNLEPGKYRVIETKPGWGYYITPNRTGLDYPVVVTMFEVTGDEEVKIEAEVTNTEVLGVINLQKLNKDTGKYNNIGDTNIAKSKFTLYAAENIYYPNGTEVIYAKGAVVGTANRSLSSTGTLKWEDLPIGVYYIKETVTGDGFVTNNTITYCDLESEYQKLYNAGSTTVPTVSITKTIENTPIKCPFAIQKFKGMETEDNTEEYLSEAGFKAYLKSTLVKNVDGTYDFENSAPVVIGENGETELFADENGYLESIALPYGTYVIVESTVPHNYKAVEPFEVVISENGTASKEVIKLVDEEFRARLTIVKKDSVSQKAILRADAEFKIKNKATDEYVAQDGNTVFKTDETGTINLKYPLRPGTYVIEEHLAPYGYTLNTEYITITVDMDSYVNIDTETMTVDIVIEYLDTPVTGKIILEKTGEVLTGYENGKFVYTAKGLADAEYALYAGENIYSIDNQVDEAGVRYIHYAKDELVGTITTDEKGLATIDNLLLGKYYLVETKAPEGFIIDTTPIEVNIEYEDQTVPVVEIAVPVTDERQKIELTLTKQDKNNPDLLLSGATYGLFAGEDIKDIEGNVIVKADSLIESATTGEDGKAVFNVDVPLGKYYFKELDAPEGFLISDEKIFVDAKYAGEDITTINASMIAADYPTLTYISKTDITGDIEIPGASLQVINADTEEIIHEWISNGEVHIIEGLPAGSYILRETIAPKGYEIARDIEFEVTEEPDAEGKPQITHVQMKDDYVYGHLAIIKNDMSGKIFLPNAVYEVRDEEGNVLDTLKTNKKGYAKSTVDYLIGSYNEKGEFESYTTYYLVEVEAPKGYELDDTPIEITFEKEKDIVLKVKDKKTVPTPETGDSNNYTRLALTFVLSFAGLILTYKRKRGIYNGEE